MRCVFVHLLVYYGLVTLNMSGLICSIPCTVLSPVLVRERLC